MDQVMRCKFRLHEVKAASSGTEPGVMVRMGAVYEPDDQKRATSENAIFGKYTPHGEYVATIYNPALVEKLPALLGREFYLDFTLAPAPAKA